MRLVKRLFRRKASASCLLRYVASCCLISCLLLVTCHVALNSKWRPLVLDFSSATSSQKDFIDWRGGKIDALRLSQKVRRLSLDRHGKNQEPHDQPNFPGNPKREKWQITFITDDSRDPQNDETILRETSDNSKKHNIKDAFNRGVKLIANAFQKSSKKPNNHATRKIPYSRDSLKFVGGPINQLPGNQPPSSGLKTILLWTPFFGKKDWLPENKLNCSYPGLVDFHGSLPCKISSDRSDLPNSDLIIIHANDIQSSFDLPKTRSANQRWLFYCQESPKHTYLELDNFTSLFNYTAVMRKDADYVIRHGGILPKVKPMRQTKFLRHIARIMASKKHLVAARISNCAPKKRLNYIAELQKYVDVDFYGLCGDKKCPKSEDECNGSKMAAYKFYLAFENSNCRDYITEKFWLPLHHWNSVPIVMGGAGPEDYKLVAPPHSYINVVDFASPQKLAEYLQLLDKNQTMYEQYFHWRRHYGNRRKRDYTWCSMCADLHNGSKPIQYYTDLKSWYHEEACVS
ncbi:4-galactosyl-N-acetylglucosaminide 3-alpha-L-fucosyltransferase FUT6-like [Liolophura sinensis]|uniref:4-galactosyl-N-acetylglucosaminide 3-alpha-L-fucosyltransferase FUT6-like n=1 Tax=Liolophura sinensis TaxID=3198878 RepID=UPI0031588AF1